MKQIDLSKTVLDIVSEYPEVVPIMKDLGFNDIVNPIILKTAGRVMTIPKGATMRNVPVEKIVEKLKEAGFSVTNI